VKKVAESIFYLKLTFVITLANLGMKHIKKNLLNKINQRAIV